MMSRMARTVALVLPALFTLLPGSAGAQVSSLDTMLDSLAGAHGTRQVAISPDGQPDFPFPRRRFRRAHINPGTQRAGAVVDFCLWQIEQIFPFDVARAHVVANRVADDFAL